MIENENHSRDQKKSEKPKVKELESLFESSFQEVRQEKGPNIDQNTPFLGANSTLNSEEKSETGSSRSKSSIRKKYEEEVEKIKKHHGSLNDIRRKLGLSQRKICLLLMVDPSAWNRWTKAENQAPPHIYRMLQWYLILQEKNPELKAGIWLNTFVEPQLSPQEIQRIKQEIVHSSRQEITSKAINYITEEDRKRNRLQRHLDDKSRTLNRLQKVIWGLAGTQILVMLLLLWRW